MKDILKFVIWVTVLSILSTIQLFYSFSLVLTGHGINLSTFVMVTIPVISTLVFQVIIHYIKRLSFVIPVIRIIVMVSPLLLSLFFDQFMGDFSFNLLSKSNFQGFTFIFIYYLLISIIGDRIRVWIETRK